MQALTFNVTAATWLGTRALALVGGRRTYWGRFSGLRLREIDTPALPGPDWVLCRTRLGGICGTDLAMIQLRQQPDSILQGFCSMPLIGGHENVAEVAEVHPSVASDWVGKRVCVEPTLGCEPRGIDPKCPRCAVGEFGACENFGAAGEGRSALPAGTSVGYNSRTGGSWGEYFVAHVSQLVEVPAPLTDAQAVVTDPIACSVHGVLRTDLTDVQSICIYGGGILGLATVAALRAVGYDGRIDLYARHAFQRDLGARLGATLAAGESDVKDLEAVAQHIGGHVVPARFGNHMLIGGYDVVYCCVSSPGAITRSLKLARARGQVILTGTSAAHEIDTTPIWFRELTIRGAYGRQLEHWGGERIGTYQLVHRWILDGTIPTEGLLTHTFPLADYRHAFAAATRKSSSACVRAAFRFT